MWVSTPYYETVFRSAAVGRVSVRKRGPPPRGPRTKIWTSHTPLESRDLGLSRDVCDVQIFVRGRRVADEWCGPWCSDPTIYYLLTRLSLFLTRVSTLGYLRVPETSELLGRISFSELDPQPWHLTNNILSFPSSDKSLVVPCTLLKHPTSHALLTSPTPRQRAFICGACTRTAQVGVSLVAHWARDRQRRRGFSRRMPHGHDQTSADFQFSPFFRLAAAQVGIFSTCDGRVEKYDGRRKLVPDYIRNRPQCQTISLS